MRRFSNLQSSLLVIVCALGLLLVAPGCASTQDTAADAERQTTSDDKVEVGYGSQEKTATTGAISTVSGEKARRQRDSNRLADLLRGNVAGVYVAEAPGGGIQVRIRGTSSIYGSNEPLYVVDGMPVEPDPGGTLAAVNPYDVESITVLKDAASASIYGARGANGVIIIKTLSGR